MLLFGLVACGDNLGGNRNPDAQRPDDASSTDAATPDAKILTTPTVLSTSPSPAATNVLLNVKVKATFSEPMDAATLAGSTFTLTTGASNVTGTAIYANSQVVFWPAAPLTSGASYTATISTAAKSRDGIALATAHTWSFMTGATATPELPVELGTSGNFVILAKAGISTVPASVITGDIGVSPATATAITMFSLTADASNEFALSTQVVGKVYASDYTAPTPATLTAAIGHMELAFTDAAGRAADVTELGEGDIGGMTLPPGVYKWGTGLLIPTNVTLAGSATDVWIFQIAQGLTISSGARVMLNGTLAKNVFWQVSGQVSLDTTAHLEGIVLGKTAVTLATLATVNGRLYAQTAVTLDQSTVAQPAP